MTSLARVREVISAMKKLSWVSVGGCSVMLVGGEVVQSSVKPSLRRGHFNKDFR